MEKLAIIKTKLLLKLDTDCVENLKDHAGHKCSSCEYVMDENGHQVLDFLNQLEDEISEETKMSLTHIAGYTTRKDIVPSEEILLNTTTFYFQKYGSYTKHAQMTSYII